ncbi:MAG: hypothetical protein BWK76_26875 [Desulfobulbaceae bacterium A2]|nr:MAG: hypothetical protein BWK76_26875 [Desulfobulbaceae bacterium A2]
MRPTPLPSGQVRRLKPGETFRFRCQPEVPCFTACCHDLELALSPYDALRLRRRLGIDSRELLDRYVIVEDEDGALPHCFLTMVDDGQASCIFLTPAGCSVYPDRPSACRSYPLGRAAYRNAQGEGTSVYHVLLREEHCQGFAAEEEHDAAGYSADQGLEPYNRMNDLLLPLVQHERLRSGMTVFPAQARLYLDTLYDIDGFVRRLAQEEAGSEPAEEAMAAARADDDERLLACAVRWLVPRLFPTAGA